MCRVKLSTDLIWSWWNNPLAVKVGNDFWFAGMATNADWDVYKNRLIHTTLDDTSDNPDDHNAPAILAKSGYDTLAFFTRHDADALIRFYRAAEGTLSFTEQTSITMPSNTTYIQILNKDNRVVLLTRSGSGKWRYVVSENYGTTWGSTAVFIDNTGFGNPYPQTVQSETDPDIYHLAFGSNPANEVWQGTVYGQINIDTGDVLNNGTVVANILTGSNMPITKDMLSDVGVDTDASANNRLLEVGDKHGKPLLYYSQSATGYTPKYFSAHFSSGSWTINDLSISAGASFGGPVESEYIGGIALDRAGQNYVYISTEASGTWEINRYDISSSMALSNKTLIDSSTTPLVRPYGIRNSDAVMWQSLETYTSYQGYYAQIYAIGVNSDIRTVQIKSSGEFVKSASDLKTGGAFADGAVKVKKSGAFESV